MSSKANLRPKTNLGYASPQGGTAPKSRALKAAVTRGTAALNAVQSSPARLTNAATMLEHALMMHDGTKAVDGPLTAHGWHVLGLL